MEVASQVAFEQVRSGNCGMVNKAAVVYLVMASQLART